MKNLNKKISAVALASMVILGGVAVSGAKSFAAPKEAIKQKVKVKNEDIQKVQDIINKAGFGSIYEVIEVSDNKSNLLDEAERLRGDDKLFKKCSMSLSSKNPEGSLKRLLRYKYPAIVVKFHQKYYLILEDII